LAEKYRVARVGYGLTFGCLPNETLSVFRKRNHRWRRPRAFTVWDHHRLAAFHDSHTGIRGPKINA
jgi:hypothetical protein